MLKAYPSTKCILAYLPYFVKKGFDTMTRRKDGRWQETITINGKTKYFYGKTKAEVLRKLRDYEEKQETGMLFEEVAEEWWEEHEPKISHTTTKGYIPAKNRAIEIFKGTPIKDIEPSMISKHIKNFSKTHADKTVRTQLMVYNHIFSYAVEVGYIPFNPARDLKVPNGLPKQKRHSPPQCDIDIVKNSVDVPFGLFAYMALYTGMRRGELLALTWSDIDIQNRVIHINKSLYHLGNQPQIKLPKTETSIGDVPILDKLYDVLKPSKGIIFANSNGEYLTNTQFQNRWYAYVKATGITSTPHQFRHAYATMLFEAGIPPEEAQVLLRHAQLSTTMDIYTDLREDKKKSIFKKVYSVDMV